MPTFQEAVDKSRKAIITHLEYLKKISSEELNRAGLDYFRAEMIGKPIDELKVLSARAKNAITIMDWCGEVDMSPPVTDFSVLPSGNGAIAGQQVIRKSPPIPEGIAAQDQI